MEEYEFDVAFSFLKEDEQFVVELDQLLTSRYKTFIFFRKQDELVGHNGEEKFSDVFSRGSRIVVVLFRKTWGQTSWTRIEETAIRNRGYVEGYDFALFIAMEKEPSLPRWLPKTQIWFDLERYGVQGAITMIEARIRQAGGQDKPETVKQRADRLKDQIALRTMRETFFGSSERFSEAKEAFELTKSTMKTIAESISDAPKGLSLQIKSDHEELVLTLLGFDLKIYSEHIRREDGLHHPHLVLIFYERNRDLFKHPPEFNEVKRLEFDFDINLSGEKGWRETSRAKTFFTPGALTEKAIRDLIEMVSLYVAKSTP